VERLWIAMIWKISRAAERAEISLEINRNRAGEGAQFRALGRARRSAALSGWANPEIPGIPDFRRVDNVWTAPRRAGARGD